MAHPSFGMVSAVTIMLVALSLPGAMAHFLAVRMESDTSEVCWGDRKVVAYKISIKNCGIFGAFGHVFSALPLGSSITQVDGAGCGGYGTNILRCDNVWIPPAFTIFRCSYKDIVVRATLGALSVQPSLYGSSVTLTSNWIPYFSGTCGFRVKACGQPCPVFPKGNPCTNCHDNTKVIKGAFLSTLPPMCPPCKLISRADCCKKCKVTTNCAYYTYDPACYECKLYTSAACGNSNFGYPTSTVVTGGPCNPQINDDPHFVGAHGVRYDFNGVPKETFCLVTDKDFHINMRLSGYYANTTVRSWIRELSFFWRAGGEQKTLQIIARTGKGTERGEGFIEKIVFNGATIDRMQPRDLFSDAASGLVLAMKPVTKLGPYTIDSYRLSIEGIFSAKIQSRVAHKLLQLPDEAETHLNLRIIKLAYSEDVHGVLGQTYREDRSDRTERFQKIVDKLNAPIHADGEDGKGFLDGELEDYETHGPLSTSCAFDRFHAFSQQQADTTTPAQAATTSAAQGLST